ncbi:unnamed protein product [Onchocerca ochengi]|uniref:Uncharacterized protein n=1 Tax=Onchocerca ochengi TaxID=42157 RepID=A0A182E8B6_ONCOC|nr:unnamed protein product [Onchocerca ochengi]
MELFVFLNCLSGLVVLLNDRQVEKISACYYLISHTLFFGMPYLFSYSHVFLFFFYEFFEAPTNVYVEAPTNVYVEAPTNASMILAGVMLKLGEAGVYRINKS